MYASIPDHILSSTELNIYEKVIAGMAHGFELNGGTLNISNEKIALHASCTTRQVQLTIKSLEDKKVLTRKLIDGQRKLRLCPDWLMQKEEKGVNIVHPPHEPASPPHEYSSPPHEPASPIIKDNIILNKDIREREEPALTPDFKSKFFGFTGEESNIGSARLKLAGFAFLALTYPEAREVHNLLKEVKFEAVNRILLHANSMGESSESRKCLSRSFGYITSAINDYKKGEQIGKPKEGQLATVRTILPQHKIVKATPKVLPTNLEFIHELTRKITS